MKLARVAILALRATRARPAHRARFAPLACLALATAACQSALPTPAEAPSSAAPARAATGAERAPLVPFGRQTPRHGPRVLWAMIGGEPETLDPARCNESLGGEVLDNLFAGLVQISSEDGQTVVGDAAERWEVSPDGLTWRFDLRPSGWSDATPVVAEDFVTGLCRVLDPNTASRSANMLFAVRGAQAYAEGTGAARDVGLRAPSHRVFEVQLARPVPYFLQLCAHSLLRPVPRHLMRRLATTGIDPMRWSRPEHLISNGAFGLKNWRFKRDFTLEKNPHYWDAAHVALEEVHVAIVESADTAVQLYRAAELDVVQTPLPTAYTRALQNSRDFTSEPFMVTSFYWLNTKQPPLDDVRVRQALSLGLDRKSLVSQVLRGAERPSAPLVPAGIAGYDSPEAELFNPARARALLAEAGYGPGGKTMRPLRLVYNTAESNRQVAEAIQAMWKTHLSLTAELENQEWRVYLGSINAGDFDIARLGWQADFADPDNFLSSVLSRHSGNNLSFWQDERFENMLAAATNMQDAPQRLAQLQRAEAFALAQQPLLPLFNSAHTALLKFYVRGYGRSIVGSHPYKHMAIVPPANEKTLPW